MLVAELPDLQKIEASTALVSDFTEHLQLHKNYEIALGKEFPDICSNFSNRDIARLLKDPRDYVAGNRIDRFNFLLGGLFCHNLHWKCLDFVNGISLPMHESVIQECINIAAAHQGSGWLWVALKNNGEAVVYTTRNHNTPYMRHQIPIFNLDLWEHAFYCDYRTKKKEYIERVLRNFVSRSFGNLQVMGVYSF